MALKYTRTMDDRSVEERPTRIRALLNEMRTHSAEARDQLVATNEQLFLRARERHLALVEEHQRALAIVRRRKH